MESVLVSLFSEEHLHFNQQRICRNRNCYGHDPGSDCSTKQTLFEGLNLKVSTSLKGNVLEFCVLIRAAWSATLTLKLLKV